MRLETITIKDIAKKLDLSTSTVSRALNDHYDGNKKTKKLVQDYARKINFSPNPFAKSLKKRKSYFIGIIVDELVNDFFVQLINGIESVAFTNNYNVIVSQNLQSKEREKLNIDHLASKSIDGLIVALSSDSKNIDYLLSLYEKGLPIVFVDRVPEIIKAHKVISNNFTGSMDATEQLILSGKRKIVHLANPETQSSSKERLEGYKAALHKYNIPFDSSLVKYYDHETYIDKELQETQKEVMALKPDGIVIANERLTTGFVSSLKNNDVKNIAIAGFSNSEMVQLFSPSTTIIRQPALEMGQVATKLLIELIESNCPPVTFRTIILDTELVKAS